MEKKILAAEEQVARLHEQVNSPGFYEQDFTETQRVLKNLEEAESEVHGLYQRWEELEAGK